MINAILMIVYIVAAVAGSTLIKYGSTAAAKTLFIIPGANMGISFFSIVGILAYGISFLLYIVLLTRFELSFISPLLIASVYVLLMLTALFIFKESFTLLKIIGCTLILIGIILILMKK